MFTLVRNCVIFYLESLVPGYLQLAVCLKVDMLPEAGG